MKLRGKPSWFVVAKSILSNYELINRYSFTPFFRVVTELYIVQIGVNLMFLYKMS